MISIDRLRRVLSISTKEGMQINTTCIGKGIITISLEVQVAWLADALLEIVEIFDCRTVGEAGSSDSAASRSKGLNGAAQRQRQRRRRRGRHRRDTRTSTCTSTSLVVTAILVSRAWRADLLVLSLLFVLGRRARSHCHRTGHSSLLVHVEVYEGRTVAEHLVRRHPPYQRMKLSHGIVHQ